MKFIEFKKQIEESLIQECKDNIAARGGRQTQVVIESSEDNTIIKVYGTIVETITVPVQLCGPVTSLDDEEIYTHIEDRIAHKKAKEGGLK